ncbi:TetR family transcriptional regulator [Actinocatenispora thailandica]|uniref:TetR family transcriptional regulator n=1 Tax=Actinocatenispora thailandica TaxID=227318 RepID=A0A7R7HUT5_9ACTN|nr:TetR/AcrR family transcriptional regulator [Actinocatenispora thailandica]BCJ32988.1 TetR family transcriptional regulator [Actinocatenispora thailandica]
MTADEPPPPRHGRPREDGAPRHGRPREESAAPRGRPRKEEAVRRGRPREDEAVRRGRPRKDEATLTERVVLDAGLRLMAADGLDAVTMRRLAAELGVRAASLYRYVRNKDELLDALADELFADLDLTRYVRDDWRAALTAMAGALRRHLLARRDSARLIAGRFTTGPNGLRNIEALLAVLRAAGLPDRDAAFTAYAWVTALFGFVAAEQNRLSAEVAAGTAPREYLDGLAGRLRAMPPERYPNVVALAGDLTAPDLAARFDFAMDRFLAGIAVLVPADPPVDHGVIGAENALRGR